MWHVHGTADTIVPYEGNLGFDGVSVEAHVEGWVERNGCAAGPEVFFDEDDVQCERWSACDEGSAVEFCTVEGGGKSLSASRSDSIFRMSSTPSSSRPRNQQICKAFIAARWIRNRLSERFASSLPSLSSASCLLAWSVSSLTSSTPEG